MKSIKPYNHWLFSKHLYCIFCLEYDFDLAAL